MNKIKTIRILQLRMAAWCLLMVFGQVSYAQDTEDEVMEADSLDAVTIISEEEAREIMNGLLNVQRLRHALQARSTMKDDSLKSVTDKFTDSTGVDVISYPYIDGDSFWSKMLKQWAKSKYLREKGNSSAYISNEVVFSEPVNVDAASYNVGVSLSSSGADNGDLDETLKLEKLSRELNNQYLEGATFNRPKDARDKLYFLYQKAFNQLPGLIELDGGQSGVDTLSPASLQKVTFSGDKYFAITDTQNETWEKLASDHWVTDDGNISSFPVCYTQGSLVRLNPEFISDRPITSTELRIKVVANDGDTKLDEDIAKASYDQEKNIVTVEDGEALEFTLPAKVKYYKDLRLTWYISLDNGDNWTGAGTSSNRLYAVLNDPLEYFIDERMLYYGCTKGEGVMDEDVFIEAVWQPFKELSLNRKDFDPESPHRLLTYYAKADPGSRSGIDLLNSMDGDGECSAFGILFEGILQLYGIKVTRHAMEVDGKDELFLVKNWEFKGDGSSEVDSYTHTNWPGRIVISNGTPVDFDIRRPNGKYHWLGTPEVSNLLGVAGQNSLKPYSDFWWHFLVSANGVVYDPSYGKTYSSLAEWEEEAVEAIFIKSKNRLYEVEQNKDLNGDGEIKDMDWLILNFKKNPVSTDFKDR